jgi:asparaginyl-tRNA synthetase
VSEFAHLEIEQCFTTFEDLMSIAERYVRYVMTQVYTLCANDLSQLVQVGKFNSEFVELNFMERYGQVLTPSPWHRIKYVDAIKLIQDNSSKLADGEQAPIYGEDMSSACEKLLTDHFGGPVFLTHWPQSIKSFYMAQLDDGTCESFDLLMPGVGELIGASQRETDYNKLLAQMEAKGINPKGLEFYTDLRKFGTAPHGGFGLGLDRFLMYMTGMKNIKDVIPYPVYYTSCNF